MVAGYKNHASKHVRTRVMVCGKGAGDILKSRRACVKRRVQQNESSSAQLCIPHSFHAAQLSHLPRGSTMQSKSQRPKDRENVVSTLNIAIDGLNIVRDALSFPGVKAVLGTVTVILTMIKVSPALGFR